MVGRGIREVVGGVGLVVVVRELGDRGDRVLISGFGDRGDPSNLMEDCWLIAWRIVGIPSHLWPCIYHIL